MEYIYCGKFYKTMNQITKTGDSEMKNEITIYVGGHHKVVCRNGIHYKIFENGTEEVDHSLNCAGWVNGCPVKAERIAELEHIDRTQF